MRDAFSTGVPAVDRELGGGIPPGTVVAFLAEPASQSELFLAEFVDRQETVYLTAERKPTAVTTALGDGLGDADDLAVKALDRDAPVVDAIEYLDRLPDGTVLIVDPIGPLERADPGQYRAFLTSLRSRLSQSGGVAVMHVLKHDDPPPQRYRTEYMADLVLDLQTDSDGGHVENYLVVPKFRNGAAVTDALRIELTDRMAVDTSRDIA